MMASYFLSSSESEVKLGFDQRHVAPPDLSAHFAPSATSYPTRARCYVSQSRQLAIPNFRASFYNELATTVDPELIARQIPEILLK